MKILSINSIPAYKNNVKSQNNNSKPVQKDVSFKSLDNIKTENEYCSPELYRQFGSRFDNYPLGSNIVAAKYSQNTEFVPGITKSNPQDRIEFFQYKYSEDYMEEPMIVEVDGVVTENKDGRLNLVTQQSSEPYTGHRVKIKNNKIVEDFAYSHGYPFSRTEYKDGEEYKLTQYDSKSNRRVWVYKKDGSFELSQYISNKDKTVIELHMLNANGDKMAVSFEATIAPNTTGKGECTVPTSEGPHKVSLYWSYPNIKYSFFGNQNDARDLKNALIELKKVIHSDEYQHDFGRTASVNRQLYDAIGYLSDLQQPQ